uniref:Uncharacterized protein n=1 Tax=Oryza sativa subsp. indica TaxID=39946 RepID=Q0P171_ORYSI|nr:hypothetical protein TQR14A11.9 [Oryza sativa Indica Group]
MIVVLPQIHQRIWTAAVVHDKFGGMEKEWDDMRTREREEEAVGNATSGGHEFATTGSSGGESSWPPDPMVPWLTEVVGDGERGVEAAAAARKEQRYGVGDDGRARRGGVDVSLARCAEATTTRED